jgi:hypothetical protein
MVRSHIPIFKSNIPLDIGDHVLPDPCIVQEVLILFFFFLLPELRIQLEIPLSELRWNRK